MKKSNYKKVSKNTAYVYQEKKLDNEISSSNDKINPQIKSGENHQLPGRSIPKWGKILIGIIAIIIVGIAVGVVLIVVGTKKNPNIPPSLNNPPENNVKTDNFQADDDDGKTEKEKTNDESETNNDSQDNEKENIDEENIPTIEEIKEILKPSFKINSNVDKLTQILMKSKQNLINKSNNLLDNTFIKAKFDVYVKSSESLLETDEDYAFYKKKITTSIVINSLCSTLEGTDCDLLEYLDLTINENENNVRNVEEEPNLEEVLLPFCLIEHTDTNIILSINCPKTIEDNLKNMIINAFKCIKPETFKVANNNKHISDTIIEEKNDKIYIKYFTKLCENNNYEDEICNINKDIITDKDGKFISCNKKTKSETDYISNEYDSIYEDIYSDDLDASIYKSNLEKLLELLKNYMNKENYINEAGFKESLNIFVNKNNNNLRQLEQAVPNIGSQEVTYFQTEYGINKVSLSLSDNICNGDISKTSSKISGENITILSHDEVNSNLTKTINDFKAISNAANALGSDLYKKINEPLTQISDKIDSEFTILYNLLAFKDLSSIYDSTFAISDINEFPYTIVSASKNIYEYINSLNKDLLYSIDDSKGLLKNSISSFLTNSHNLIYQIFNNLREFTNVISSKKSKIANIAAFYGLNNTNTSFVNIIENANEILNNYYKNEKNLIEPLLNELFDKFLKNSNELIKNSHYIFDNITNRLENESIIINRGNEDDIRNVIDYLYNTKIIEYQIINNIPDNMKKNIMYNNGYFVSQNFIEENKNSYTPTTENALNAAINFDNNEYIDETFDDIMNYFRDQFLVILKNMEKSKSENFPININVLSNTKYFNTSFEELESFLNNEKVNIYNLFKNENNNFMSLIKQKIKTFLDNNEKKLQDLINKINDNLSELILNNIDIKYNETLEFTKGNISEIIDDNNKLLLKYIDDIKSTTHLTQTIKDKLNIYKNKAKDISNYIKYNLKNDLSNKYKNIINKIRQNLQSIKSNTIIKKYYEYKNLSLFKSHIDIFIEPLFSILNKYISDKLYNTNYLPKINEYIDSTLSEINKQLDNLDELYSPIKQKTYTGDSKNDIYYKVKKEYCSVELCFLFWCWCLKTGTYYEYKPKKVDSTNIHNSLRDVAFENYSIDFDKYFNEIYDKFSKNIYSYNNIVLTFGNELQVEIDKYSNKVIDYLNSISNKAKSFLNEELGINVLKSSYNYYKDELNKYLPIELNSIFEQWKSLFNKVYNDIDTNINKFKYPIEEFSNLAIIYYEYYYQNISYSYSDTIIEQVKNDFNHTIQFYYNLYLSKVNKTYTYILNNIPTNEKPFDTVLDKQINQVKNSYNEILTIFLNSKREILNIKKQLNTLKVSETNFFDVNSYAIDIAEKIENELAPLSLKFNDIQSPNKFDSEESVACRFYLENLKNGEQINNLYEKINKGTFIEFQNEAYQNLFEEILEIDEIDLRNKILDFLKKSNQELDSIFEVKRENYKNILQEEIFKQYCNNTEIENKIDLIYSEGLNDLDINSKNKIVNYINEIIEKIKKHLSNENERLINQLTSYSNNYNIIEQRLNEINNKIYEQFYSTIYSVINNFYFDINQKFYINYIEKYLEIYYNNTKNEKFSEHKFLNTSFNLKKIMDEEIELLISEYKNLTLKHIIFLNDQKIQHLNELFSIENLKKDIKTKINNYYKNILLPTLKIKATNNPGDEGVSDYDFSIEIMNDINSLINTKINEANVTIQKMKGNKYNIEENWKIPDFSLVKKNVFDVIKRDFNENFVNTYESKEISDFNIQISKSINSNFKQIIDNFVPSFGKDYFERILKYNEIQKIQSLYDNLKYSLGVTLTYYIFLTFSNSIDLMPEDLEIKILSLNDIDSIVNLKNDEVLSILNSKFDEFLELSKNKLVDKYINYMKNDITLKNSLDENIMDLLKVIIENKKYIFEDEYINMMNTYIKNPFIEKYKNTLIEKTNDMFNFIEENKEYLRIELENVLTMNEDEALNNIEIKLNNTLKAIDNYNSHFKSFKIPEEVKNFLDNYVENNILSKHQDIKKILDDRTKNIIIEKLKQNSEDFKNAYSNENMEIKLNETNDLFKNELIDNILESLKNYGTIEDVYLQNLEKEIVNYSNRRRLRGLEEFENFVDIKLDTTFKSLKESSESVKQNIETINIFSDFNNKINKYINKIKEQYEFSKNLIKNRKYTEEVNDELYQSLDELKNISISYYNKVKLNYDKIKEYVENSILTIDKLINQSNDITYKIIYDKYQEIKDNYNSINEKNENEGEIDDSFIYSQKDGDKFYKIEVTINKFLYENNFNFDINSKDGLVGKSVNQNRPKSFVVDFSTKIGKCIEKGKKMNVVLNNVSSIIDINFNASSTETIITKKYNILDYSINNEFYNETLINKTSHAGGVRVQKLSCVYQNLETPTGEKNKEDIEGKSDIKIEKF